MKLKYRVQAFVWYIAPHKSQVVGLQTEPWTFTNLTQMQKKMNVPEKLKTKKKKKNVQKPL